MQLIRRDLIQRLLQALGPGNFDLINAAIAESEVQRSRGMREVPACGTDLPGHNAVPLMYSHHRPDGVAVAPRPTEPKLDEVLLRELVLEEIRLVVEVVDHDVE